MVTGNELPITPAMQAALGKLVDTVSQAEAEVSRAIENHYAQMDNWGPNPDDTESAGVEFENEVRRRLEAEMSLWHEDNGWAAAMPESDRQGLVDSIRTDLSREWKREGD